MRTAIIVLTLLSPGWQAQAENIVFPEDAGLVDVTMAPYNLKGDGKTDNTEALRRAFHELRGSNLTLYFPNGTYLLSERVNISGDEPSKPHSKDRFLHIQGQSEAGVVIKLRDNSPGFDDPEEPRTFISLYEGRSTGDVMHSYVRNITIEIGKGNPGAAALRYLSNNSGAMYDVTVRSADPAKAGAIGLDLRQSQQGPALIKRVTVDGFDHGIEVGNSFSMVFEHITLSNQRKAGFVNNNARTTMRGFRSNNVAPAITNGKHGHLALVDAKLTGGAPEGTAIETSSPKVLLRDVKPSGYGHTVKTSGGEYVDGDIEQWYDGKAQSLFDCPAMTTLRLPIEETPEIPWETDISKWVRVDPAGTQSGRSLQEAIDEAARLGKTTVYLPKLTDKKRKYVVDEPIRVHGSVNRIIGMENILWIEGERGSLKDGSVVFTFEDLDGPFVIERFFNILKHRGWKGLYNMYLFENKSEHPVVIRNLAHGACLHKKPSPGRTWFIEDMAGGRQALFGRGEKVWMRQYNPESPDIPLCEVDGGQAWILGFKTEGRCRHIIARNGAKVELLGGVSYQSWKKQPLDPPMFTVVDSDASFTFGFYHWNLPFTTIVEETRGTKTRTLARKELERYHLPLFRACGATVQERTGEAVAQSGDRKGAGDASAHNPQYDNRKIWPQWVVKTDFYKEKWPKARVLVYARAGETIRGVDLMDPANWLEDGEPASEPPDEGTDIIFPTADKRYHVGGKKGCPARHMTVEAGVSAFLKHIHVYGNMWIKDGGSWHAIQPRGPRNTFMRNDNPEVNMAANKIALNKPPGNSIEWIGIWNLGDELDLFSGDFIVSPGSTFMPGDRSTQHIYPDGRLILTSGSAFYKRGNQYRMHDMEIVGRVLAGTPQRPLTEDCTLGISFKAKGKGKDRFHNTRPEDKGLILYKEGKIAVHSADPENARLVIRRNRMQTRAFKRKGGEPADVAAMPHGIDLVLLGETDFNGVEFQDILEGGIQMPDPGDRRQWKNVAFKNNLAPEDELFTRYSGPMDIEMRDTGIAKHLAEAAKEKEQEKEGESNDN